jgi:hypothetical protein
MMPQEFVDHLNRSEMPRLGYHAIEEDGKRYYGWPVYDQSQRDESDLFYGSDKKSYGHFESIERQAKRLGRYCYKDITPADERTRKKV